VTKTARRDIAGEHMRAFIVYHLGPTTHRGSRVKIIDTRHEVSKVIPWDYVSATAAQIAAEYLSQSGIRVDYHAWREDKDEWILFSSDFGTSIK
jgi:hypothetical protein|tara:strand:- start:13389 stop:13670 length:282 start_codon:yes stop_codon:yes gene_type:complete